MINRKESFSIQTRKVGSVTIFDMSGHLSMGEPVDELLASAGTSVDKNEVRIILNMANVGYIDSAGIESLIRIYKAARERNGEVTAKDQRHAGRLHRNAGRGRSLRSIRCLPGGLRRGPGHCCRVALG